MHPKYSERLKAANERVDLIVRALLARNELRGLWAVGTNH